MRARKGIATAVAALATVVIPSFIVVTLVGSGGASAVEHEGASKQASAQLKDTDGNDVGTVSLRQTPYGTLLHAKLSGLPSGTHAFHVHETGACDAPDFKSAGGHLNPADVGHGFLDDDGVHAGDMPNIHVPQSGDLEIEVFNSALHLDATVWDDDGSAIVIHEGADDYETNPAGDAGSRIACGVIETQS